MYDRPLLNAATTLMLEPLPVGDKYVAYALDDEEPAFREFEHRDQQTAANAIEKDRPFHTERISQGPDKWGRDLEIR